MEKAYSKAIWELPEDFLEFTQFERILYTLDRTSSPGYPYCNEAPTIGEWLKFDGVQFDQLQVHRLWVDVQNVIKGDFDHIFRVFIKMEPHTKKKEREKRWRLIIASALSVQVVWNMLFSPIQNLEIDNAHLLPSQQGMILCNGGWKLFLDIWTRKGFNCGLDKSAWDWTYPFWMLMLDLELVYRLGRGKRMQEWLNIALWLHKDAFQDARIMLSDGRIFQQVVDGMMKSGLFPTISKNSRGTIIAHIYNCILTNTPIYPLPAAVGDDSLQDEEQVKDLSGYEKMGIVIKEITRGLEFVGNTFTPSGPAPLYIKKHLFKLPYVKEEHLTTYVDAMARMYAHSEHYELWQALASVLRIPIHSRKYYQMWYDYEGLTI